LRRAPDKTAAAPWGYEKNTDEVQRSPPGPGIVDKGTAVVLTAIAGGLIALQAPINSNLAKSTGDLPAASLSFLIGTVALVALVVISGKAGGLGHVADSDVRWYYLVGGLLGAVYVANALVAVNSIGAGGVAAATIAGQLTASVVADRLGVLGLDQVALSPARLIGVGLLLLGTVLIVR
jgi:transporter family-2 protein